MSNSISSALHSALHGLVHWALKAQVWFEVQTQGTKVKAQAEHDVAAEEDQVVAQLEVAVQGEIVKLAADKAILLADAKSAILPTIDTIAKDLAAKATSNTSEQTAILNYVNGKADTILETAFTAVIDSATGQPK